MYYAYGNVISNGINTILITTIRMNQIDIISLRINVIIGALLNLLCQTCISLLRLIFGDLAWVQGCGTTQMIREVEYQFNEQIVIVIACLRS